MKYFEEVAILDAAEYRKAGFQAPSEEQSVKDALVDDLVMKEIIDCKTAMELLVVKKKIATTPLTEIDRRIYSEAIEAKCRVDFNHWDVEAAARKEQEKAKAPMGFQVENATVTIATDDVEPKFTVIADQSGEERDFCISQPTAITDSQGQPTGWYKQIVSKVDALNGNNRLYPRPVYGPALDELKKARFPFAGEHPHPPHYKDQAGRVQFKSSVPNQAVKFRNAEIDPQGNVWAEYKPLQTEMGKQVQAMLDEGLPLGFSNRMTGSLVPAKVNSKTVSVARALKLYTWDVVLNPAEMEAFDTPIPLTDSAVAEILDSIKEEGKQMNFLTMSLNELKAWKSANTGHTEMALCDEAIRLKEAAEQNVTVTDELEKLRKEKADREAREVVERKKGEAQTALTDAVNTLPYDQKTKDALLKKGEAITDAAQVEGFIAQEKAFIDSIAVQAKLSNLGVPIQGRAAVTVEAGAAAQPWKPIVDNLMAAFDDQIRSKDRNFRVDTALREANKAIIDRILAKMDRENNETYKSYMQSLTDSAASFENGVINDAAMSATGDFAQASVISTAFMYQVWQDLNFAQLMMAESFAGSTYKIPVEFQSHDLFTQDDFVTGEYDGITTEGVETFLLEFGGEWLKRGTVVSKEAVVEMMKGPFNYDVVARNLANLANRYKMVKDQKMSLEMLHVSDEYEAKAVANEAVAATEIAASTGLPAGSNAAFTVKLLCGYASGSIGAQVPPVVRPRKRVWLDQFGRKQSAIVNEIVAKKGASTLTRGTWDPVKGKINNGDYAVDFENSLVYFAAASGVDAANRPVISYSYATNVSFFSLTVPNGVKPSEYFNYLLERFDYEKAYMGSAPRYVTPDFAIGSLNGMVNLKIAELFYKWASPEGTNFLKGSMWFANRNGLQLGEMNAPWSAGDKRILLGKTNATRFGVGSPLQIEGPEPYFDPTTMKITSAKQYYATEQIALATPLVIDGDGKTYNPPYRTIKFY